MSQAYAARVEPVVTAGEMRALDRATIEDIGLPAMTLMETAGRAVAAAAIRMAPAGHIAVVCGPGNNGGDGFVTARVLRGAGFDAVVYLAVPRDVIRGDAAAHLAIYERAGGVIRAIDTPQALGEVDGAIMDSALVVDALFGVGLARPIEGHLAEVVGTMVMAERTLAVDIPSGLDTDTGRVLGAAVTADCTVTMAALKVALVSAPGFARCGVLEVADIGIPPSLIAASGIRASLVGAADVLRWLPRAHELDHKGRRGHVVVVAGSPGMRGAGRLAATTALRAGAGLCTLAGEGAFDAPDSVMTRTLGVLAPLLDGKAAVVIGPGIGTASGAASHVAEVLAAGVPAVLDADALNIVAGKPGALAAAAGPIVITPHPGEASRLLGISVAEIEADRLAAARKLAAQTRAVVVLKGARTIVCDGTIGDDHCSINPTGGPSLATGGSGDVLAGTIGGLLAQGLSAVDAARAGVYIHGRAGDDLAKIFGDRGVMSSDLPEAIAKATASLE